MKTKKSAPPVRKKATRVKPKKTAPARGKIQKSKAVPAWAVKEEYRRYYEFLKALMDNSPDYIYFKDKDSRFLRINAAHARAFGLSDPAQAIGKSDFDFFTKDHAQPAFDGEQEIIKTGKPIIGLVERETRADGRVSWVSTTKLPLRDSQERIIGTFGISRDVTEQKRAEQALHKAMEDLKKANEAAENARRVAEAASQAKGMFLARMSHEIRTPMNSVIGFSDMLLDTEMTEEQVEFVRNITKSGEALLALINEILDFSKIEAGQLTFQNIDFDLEITAFDVCSITQPRLGNKPVEILCHVGDTVPGFIKSDPARVRQVLLNLMGNAMKFTEEGEIELDVFVEEETEKRLKLHTTVRDTGIGIPKDKLNTVFELFQQADGSVTRKYGGTGPSGGRQSRRSVRHRHPRYPDARNQRL